MRSLDIDVSRLASLTLADLNDDRQPRDAIFADRRTSVHGSSKGSSLAASPLTMLRRRADRSPSVSPVASVHMWLQQQQQQLEPSTASPTVANQGSAEAMVATGWERGLRSSTQPNGAQAAQAPAASVAGARSVAPAVDREADSDSASPAAGNTPREGVDLTSQPPN